MLLGAEGTVGLTPTVLKASAGGAEALPVGRVPRVASRLAQLREAIDAGLSMFTHLGNGCPAQLPRHDNIVERVLSLSDDGAALQPTDTLNIPDSFVLKIKDGAAINY